MIYKTIEKEADGQAAPADVSVTAAVLLLGSCGLADQPATVRNQVRLRSDDAVLADFHMSCRSDEVPNGDGSIGEVPSAAGLAAKSRGAIAATLTVRGRLPEIRHLRQKRSGRGNPL